jgi:CRP/FNR family cyclic AMP-dependent transcriptional regulator
MAASDANPIVATLDQFFGQYPRQNIAKGQTIVQANQQPINIFYLTNGKVKQYTISQKGNEVTLNIFQPYAFFPMGCIVNQTPNTYYYDAITDVELRKAPSEDVITFIKNQPAILYDLLQRVYRGTDGLIQRLNYLLADNTYASLINELLITARRFGQINQQGQAIVTINQSDIGALSGMSRETVSREMSLLKQKDLISLNRHQLIIRNIHELEAELFNHT